MNYFTKLIAKSYNKYTKEKDKNIALIYYQAYEKKKTKFTKNQFFKKLIVKLDKFIEDTDFKSNWPNKIITEEEYYISEQIKKDEEFMLENEATYMLYCEQEGIPYNPPKKSTVVNWEECDDAEMLIRARNNGINFKDPFTIIRLNEKKRKKDLTLRKSKLEYLKLESIRARDAESLKEIDYSELSNSNKSCSDRNSDTYLKVSQAFKFTLSEDPRKKKQILSQQDFDYLVCKVTEYFESDLTLPEINHPIKQVNTSRGNIVQTFIDIFTELVPEKSNSKPPNYWVLIQKCFNQYGGVGSSNISKSKPSLDYDKLKNQKPLN